MAQSLPQVDVDRVCVKTLEIKSDTCSAKGLDQAAECLTKSLQDFSLFVALKTVPCRANVSAYGLIGFDSSRAEILVSNQTRSQVGVLVRDDCEAEFFANFERFSFNHPASNKARPRLRANLSCGQLTQTPADDDIAQERAIRSA